MRVLTFLFLSLLALPAAAGIPSIKVLVSPHVVVSAPLEQLRVEVQIARHPDNRGFCIEVDGPEYFSSSCESLAGETAKVIYSRFMVHLMRDGKYTVSAVLYRKENGDQPYSIAKETVLVGGQQAANLVGEGLIAP